MSALYARVCRQTTWICSPFQVSFAASPTLPAALAAGAKLPAPAPVFPRYVEPGLEAKEGRSQTSDNKKGFQQTQDKSATFPVEKLDLELAFRRIKADLRSDRYFVHSPIEIELAEIAFDDWLNQLRKKVAEGYRPHSALVADIPKGNGAVRPGALLALEDRVVYAAAVGAILPSINAGLGWSQGTVDFGYQLSKTQRRVEWFTNTFNSWSAFRKASLERIEKGATYVVLTDVTGFYENIDLPTLFSDLRSLGADPHVIRLLEGCLNRWCVIPNRGLPQGLSASDVLAKVYLNAIDRALADTDIDYIRYVDDMRIFCHEIPACKEALMFLTQALRRRGLNLQSAKTEILPAAEARRPIEGITPIISDVIKGYREFVEKMGSINPYAPISQIEENVEPNDPPVEVVQEAFRLNFIDKPKHFNKTLFHFLLNRLGAQKDGYALEYCLDQLAVNPQETRTLLRYVERVVGFNEAFVAIELFLNSPDCIYDYQAYEIFRWLNLVAISPSPGLVAIARRVTFDSARPSYLRAVCRVVLQNYGTTADLDRLEAIYGSVHDDLEKGQILVSLQGLELERRNEFYARVASDGELCERAIKLVQNRSPAA